MPLRQPASDTVNDLIQVIIGKRQNDERRKVQAFPQEKRLKSTCAGNEECDYGAMRDNCDGAFRMLRNCGGNGVGKPCVSVIGSLLAEDESLSTRKELRNAIIKLLLGRKESFIAPIVFMEIWRCSAVCVEQFGNNLSGFLSFRFIAGDEYVR